VEQALAADRDVVLEIDWQGARQVKHLLPESCAIFVLPPSEATLRERLTGRGQDDPATIERRMAAAVSEMSHYVECDYLVINDRFELALEELRSVIQCQRLQTAKQARRHAARLRELLGSAAG
jgi:guanylate kinase